MNQEVNKIVQELYACLPNDRNKFNSIMENLKVKFLSSPNSPQINYNIKLPNTNYSSQLLKDNLLNSNNIPPIKNNININNNTNYINDNADINSSLNPLKANYNFQPINLPTYNIQNKQYDSINNDELGDYININNNGFHTGTFNENNLYENKIQNDIHANVKYYYPEEYNLQFNDNKNQNNDWNMNQINNNNLMYGSKNNFYKTQSDV